jgi:hypothetical protein
MKAQPIILNAQYPNQYPVSIRQDGKHRFTVTYGKQVTSTLTYAEAAKEVGECIMHAFVCDGLLGL